MTGFSLWRESRLHPRNPSPTCPGRGTDFPPAPWRRCPPSIPGGGVIPVKGSASTTTTAERYATFLGYQSLEQLQLGRGDREAKLRSGRSMIAGSQEHVAVVMENKDRFFRAEDAIYNLFLPRSFVLILCSWIFIRVNSLGPRKYLVLYSENYVICYV